MNIAWLARLTSAKPTQLLRWAMRLLLTAGLLWPLMATAQTAQKRVALVIGNSAYEHLPRLKNPANDMREVVGTLRAAQFDVISGGDLNRIEFEELLKTFLRSVEGADISLIYYSGHGIQIGGRNYLVPVNARLSTPYDVEIESINVDNIYAYVKEHSRMQFVFLDACRDNPFRAEQYWIADRLEKPGKAGGLAMPANLSGPSRKVAGLGSLFAFSTEPDKVAYDGAGDLSHYTQAFVRRALTPNIEVRQMLTQVRRDVIQSTNGQQIPWENSSLIDDFFMVQLPAPPVTSPIHRVSAVAGGPATALDLPMPRSLSGSPLAVSIDRLPEKGRLLLDNKPMTTLRPMQVAELARLRYDPAGVPIGHVELLTYAASDNWKQSSQGAIAITVTEATREARSSARPAGARPPLPTPAPVAVAQSPIQMSPNQTSSAQVSPAQVGPAQVRPAQVKPAEVRGPDGAAARRQDKGSERAHAYVSSLRGQVLEAPIGVGPASLTLPPAGGGEEITVSFAQVPASGSLFAGSRRIETGTTVTMAELAGLAFEPQVASQGQSAIVKLVVDTGDRRSTGTLTLRPVLDACDIEAAEPFDLQGVAPGRLPNEINPGPALQACQRAMSRYPAVARFQFQLGRAHLAARAVEQGWRDVEAAADRGHVRALYQLGYLLRLGVGRPASQSEAVDYFRRGAERGDPYGIYDYGKALFYGRGVAKDVPAGLRLMLRAADMGHTYAMNELGYIFTDGIDSPRDTERGIRFYRSGVDRRDIYSFNNIGLAYLQGKGVPRDPAAALTYFRRAADGGHPYAPTNLGRLLRDGVGVRADTGAAVAWFEKGAERGDYWGALDRARLALEGGPRLRNPVDAGYFLALASAINRPGTGDSEDRARRLLESLPAADKQKVEQRLLRQLGPETGAGVAAATPDDRLIALARQAWIKRNPRIDLF